MKTVRDKKLFEELKKNPKWETLFQEEGTLKNPYIPILWGGLDHIEITPKGIYFFDIGATFDGITRDNSFVVKD